MACSHCACNQDAERMKADALCFLLCKQSRTKVQQMVASCNRVSLLTAVNLKKVISHRCAWKISWMMLDPLKLTVNTITIYLRNNGYAMESINVSISRC